MAKDRYPNYILKLTLERLVAVRDEIEMYNKYILPTSEIAEIVNNLNESIKIMEWNIADNERKHNVRE